MPAPEGSVQGRFWSYRLLDCKPNKVPWLIGDDESLLDESVSDLLIVGEYNEGGEECNCCSSKGGGECNGEKVGGVQSH